MYYFLINATIIWLASLLVYEFLLKQETFHRQNRLFLLGTFVLGILLPLLPWPQHFSAAAVSVNEQPAKGEMPQAANTAVDPGNAAAASMDAGTVLWLLYGLGAAIALGVLLAGAFRLYRAYSKGVKSRQGKWTIVATGRVHNPYSFLTYIFVSSREQYTAAQWQMLLEHEQEHYHLRHLADLLLLQLCGIAFWFHPLVYSYRRRLQLIHEYEVDCNINGDIATYGRFLLEQAMLSPAPALAHSFDYSPIKNRIMMLTKQSSAPRQHLKMLLLLPLLAGFAVCCAQSKSDLLIDATGKGVSLRGNNIKFSQAQRDTIWIEDPETRKRRMLISEGTPQPLELNGQKVSPSTELTNKPAPLNGKDLTATIRELKLDKYLSKLPDGRYNFNLNNVLIDPNGKIIYFENNGYNRISDEMPADRKEPRLDKQDETKMNQQLAEYLLGGGLMFTPGQTANGNKTPFVSDQHFFHTSFQVSDHKLSIVAD